MLQLIDSPLPDHLVDEDGLIYSRALVVRDEELPGRFSASVMVEGAEGLSWHGLVTGLETDRANMRARFESVLATASGRQRARLSTALSACYSGLFGFRSASLSNPAPSQVAFDAWVAGLSIKPDRARAAYDAPASEAGARMAELGCRLVPFSPETGHVPVGHDLLLYLLAEVEPMLVAAEFSEVARFDPDAADAGDVDADDADDADDSDDADDADDADESAPSPYTLQAWCDSRAYEAAAHAYGDFYDVISVVGFLNAILRDVDSGNRFRLLGEDEGRMAHGPLESIRELDDEDE